MGFSFAIAARLRELSSGFQGVCDAFAGSCVSLPTSRVTRSIHTVGPPASRFWPQLSAVSLSRAAWVKRSCSRPIGRNLRRLGAVRGPNSKLGWVYDRSVYDQDCSSASCSIKTSDGLPATCLALRHKVLRGQVFWELLTWNSTPNQKTREIPRLRSVLPVLAAAYRSSWGQLRSPGGGFRAAIFRSFLGLGP